MKSPFPGLDPYLEPHWLDVHTKLVAYAADDLNEQLPADLVASTEERLAVESSEDDVKVIGPDVRVFEPPTDTAVCAEAPASGFVLAPYRLATVIEPIVERFIRVIEAGTERLITVIEFVSPTNKRGEGLEAFRVKRASLLESGVNFVEIDLVRAGNWRALLYPSLCPRKATAPYRVTFRVPVEPGYVYLYPISLRGPLPNILIPLRRQDPEVRLDLQSLLDRVYVNGRYEQRSIYRHQLEPPLAAEDADWADELLKKAGKR